ncbi:MAG: FAD-dependent oxidoreductase [Peptostreptococcaceae bacterium]|nr:FAD-dependent oxidoreductase [Peptostreptococcaceae bacterium]
MKRGDPLNAYDYDCIIIGGGAAGLSAAFTTKGFGRKTALVEKNRIGGECTWMGCIPSKTLIKVAGEFNAVNNMGEFGIKTDELRIDTKSVMKHVRETIELVYASETPEKLNEAGIDVLEGEAKFEDSHHLNIDGETVSFDKAIICTGTRPEIPSVGGLDEAGVLTNETIFELEELPRSIAIIGAGAIAIEMAQALSRLGIRVTIIQRSGRILKKEEPELSEILMRRLETEGVRFVLNAEITSVSEKLGHKVLSIRIPEGEETFETEAILVATGRFVDLKKLNPEKAGVVYDGKGIKVNEQMQTSVSGIYAAGDVTGPWRFSHMAYYQGITAGRNASIPIKKKMDYSTVGWCLFTDPELAHLGLTEEEAQAKCGKKGCRVFVEKYDNLDRAITDHTKQGLVKVITDKRGKILGAHILGSRAGEIMHELSVLKGLDQPFYKLNDIIHVYPTYSDILRKLAQKAYIEKLSEQPIIKGMRKAASGNKKAISSDEMVVAKPIHNKKNPRKGKEHD